MTSLASTQTLLERTGAIRLGLVGLGKIARDAHLPAIAQTPSIQLFAIASRNAALSELPHYHDLTSMLEREPKLQAIVLCQPPQVRYAAARAALAMRRAFRDRASLGSEAWVGPVNRHGAHVLP